MTVLPEMQHTLAKLLAVTCIIDDEDHLIR
jgi:hypothetical protein